MGLKVFNFDFSLLLKITPFLIAMLILKSYNSRILISSKPLCYWRFWSFGYATVYRIIMSFSVFLFMLVHVLIFCIIICFLLFYNSNSGYTGVINVYLAHVWIYYVKKMGYSRFCHHESRKTSAVWQFKNSSFQIFEWDLVYWWVECDIDSNSLVLSIFSKGFT